MGMEFVNDLAANNIIDYGTVSKINRAYGTTSKNNQGTYNAFVRVSAPDTFTRSTREKETMVTGGLLAGTAALTGVAIAKGKKATKKGIAGIKETFSKIFNKKTVETAAEATTAAAGTPAGAAATATGAAADTPNFSSIAFTNSAASNKVNFSIDSKIDSTLMIFLLFYFLLLTIHF